MSVLINGMKMPKDCESCQFKRCISDLIMFGWVGCQLDVGMAKKESFKGRHPDCPLVEIKSPHGRLIDADALEQDAQKRMLICNKNDNQFQKPYEVMRAIALAPTIIQAAEG